MEATMRRKLAALSMRPGDDVKPVLDKIKDTYARMAAAGSKVSQMQQCTKIISVLDNSWDNLIPTLNTEQDQWTPEWLRQQILQEDFRSCHTRGGAANKTAEGYGAAGGSGGRGGGRGRGRGRGFGRGRGLDDYNEGHGSSGGRGSTRMEGACWYCKKAGHPWFKCFSRPEGWAPPGMKPPSNERANGGAVRAPPRKIKFVAAASGALLPVIGVGNAKVMGANGELVGLGNILLCEEEKSSCIKDLWQLPIIPWNGKPPATATAAATAKETVGGEETPLTDGALDAVKKVQQPHGEVLPGMDATAAWVKTSSGNGEADWETWHKRLCHINIPMLQNCFPSAAAQDKPRLHLHLCTWMWWAPRGPFLSRAAATSGPLCSTTHVLCGVYPLKTVLMEWMPKAQRERGHKMKVILTDNGGEFIGNEFEAVLKKKGIQHQLTVPYNPQQNGVAERFNRTLQEGARTLLGRAGLPDPFWVTALRQVALVKNRVLATVGDKQWVPYTQQW
ncbi:unnamed protein product [Closterium sp. Yama58-4]|nr:unnamed protein product [Closterium sp. Yama58-4]